MILEAIMWTLITVTNGGQVSESRHATKESCEQAKSIAVTGMTIEENKAADDAHARYLKKWDEDHPWRDPKNEDERQLVKDGGFGSMSWGGPYGIAYDGKTGKVRETQGGSTGMSYSPNNGESVDYARGQYLLKHRGDIKYAKCIPPESS